MHAKTQLLQHAQKRLATKGQIAIRNFRRLRDCFAATIIVTTATQIEHYSAYVDGGAIGMVKTKSTAKRARHHAPLADIRIGPSLFD